MNKIKVDTCIVKPSVLWLLDSAYLNRCWCQPVLKYTISILGGYVDLVLINGRCVKYILITCNRKIETPLFVTETARARTLWWSANWAEGTTRRLMTRLATTTVFLTEPLHRRLKHQKGIGLFVISSPWCLKPEFTIVIFSHNKPRIPIAILNL